MCVCHQSSLNKSWAWYLEVSGWSMEWWWGVLALWDTQRRRERTGIGDLGRYVEDVGYLVRWDVYQWHFWRQWFRGREQRTSGRRWHVEVMEHVALLWSTPQSILLATTQWKWWYTGFLLLSNSPLIQCPPPSVISPVFKNLPSS